MSDSIFVPSILVLTYLQFLAGYFAWISCHYWQLGRSKTTHILIYLMWLSSFYQFCLHSLRLKTLGYLTTLPSLPPFQISYHSYSIFAIWPFLLISCSPPPHLIHSSPLAFPLFMEHCRHLRTFVVAILSVIKYPYGLLLVRHIFADMTPYQWELPKVLLPSHFFMIFIGFIFLLILISSCYCLSLHSRI